MDIKKTNVWIDHDGSDKCPVHPEDIVRIKIRGVKNDGDAYGEARLLSSYHWKSISHYMVVIASNKTDKPNADDKLKKMIDVSRDLYDVVDWMVSDWDVDVDGGLPDGLKIKAARKAIKQYLETIND